MKDDAISRQAVLNLLSTMPPEEATTKAILIQSVQQMSAVQPDEEKISDLLYEVYRLTCSQLGTGGVEVLKYYIREIYREIYGEEGPGWMKK